MKVAEIVNEDLRKWFKEKWVRFGPDGKIRGDCARGSSKEGKPKCLPQAKAHALGRKVEQKPLVVNVDRTQIRTDVVQQRTLKPNDTRSRRDYNLSRMLSSSALWS